MFPTKSNRQPKYSERYLNYLSTISKQIPSLPPQNSPSSSTLTSTNQDIFPSRQFLQFYTKILHHHHYRLTFLNRLVIFTSQPPQLIPHPTIIISHISSNLRLIHPKCLTIQLPPIPKTTPIISK